MNILIMKIIVISNFPTDSNYAHAINVIKLADAFANIGHQVIIICRDPNSKDFLKRLLGNIASIKVNR